MEIIMTNRPLSVDAHEHGVSLCHMAHKTRPILVDENETQWRMLARSGKVIFCKLTDLEKRGETTDGRRTGTASGPPDADRSDSLDTRDSGFLSPQKNSW